MTISNLLKKKCESAFTLAFPNQTIQLDPTWIEIKEATQEKFGHYQLNSAMRLAKLLHQSPVDIAQQMVAALKSMPESTTLFSKIDIAGPGFINFTLQANFLAQTIHQQLHDPRLRVLNAAKPRKVIIDFSSPNTAKEMHIGHLRSTIIGDCLARILKFIGHDVIPLNHVGDWGTQFGMLIAYLKEVVPELAKADRPFIELSNLVTWYQAAKKRFDEDPEFKKQAQQEVVALQSGVDASKRTWEQICEISRQSYQQIYALLDVHLIERGESFYNPLLKPLIVELEQKGILTTSEGAKCIYVEGFNNREGTPLPLILQKSDGGFNYATTDMAALRQRVQQEKADWIIYVTDAGQSLHFQMIFAAAQKAGFYDPHHVQIDHVPFGLVLKPDGKKFQTRSGKTEKLMDVLETAIQKAKEKLIEHNPDMSPEEIDEAANVLGINAIKYADLSSHRLSDYIFSYDKMLKFEGNTAAFLLYAYVRIRSIQKKASLDISQLLKQNASIVLEEPSEIALGLLVCQFNEALENTVRELLPNRLTDYLYRLAEKFHVFFHQCRVEGSSQQTSRLLLCEAVAQVLHQGIQLLGLKPLSRM